MNKEDLIGFEEEIKQLFLDKKIRSPVHLSVGSEEPLIKIFKKVKRDDWVFSTHRSHYHALLKGVDREWLKNEILENRSIHIYNKEHKIFTSAIMGGILPIAVGVAMALKRKKSKNRVWAFIGDMAATMGITHECMRYAAKHNLPITFVIEDNGLSVNTPTEEVWGKHKSRPKIVRYKYKRVYPHQGVGIWVVF
jgi:pyruvate dehydrogenase E1 component alpha subunit